MVKRYHLKMTSLGFWQNSGKVSKELTPNERLINVENIVPGEKHSIEITTYLLDLDTNVIKDYKYKMNFSTGDVNMNFCCNIQQQLQICITDPEKVILESFKWDDGVITITWGPVPGAESYQLILKDDMQKETFKTVTVNASQQCAAMVQLGENLRVGQAFTAKVIACLTNKKTCESDWRPFFIGKKL